jgi:hypothetical protein
MANTIECSWGIGEMFKDIEHRNKVEPFVGTEGLVEPPDVNALSPVAVVIDGVDVRLNPEDIAEAREVVEHEPVAATDVQNGTSGSTAGMFVEHAVDDGQAGPPPPVVLVEMPKLGDEIGVHGGKSFFTLQQDGVFRNDRVFIAIDSGNTRYAPTNPWGNRQREKSAQTESSE